MLEVLENKYIIVYSGSKAIASDRYYDEPLSAMIAFGRKMADIDDDFVALQHFLNSMYDTIDNKSNYEIKKVQVKFEETV